MVSKSAIRNDRRTRNHTVLEHGKRAAKTNGETLSVLPDRSHTPFAHGVGRQTRANDTHHLDCVLNILVLCRNPDLRWGERASF